MDKLMRNIVVSDSGCWEYQGAKTNFGYGKIGRRVNGKSVFYVAHRYVYLNTVGQIPEGMRLCHICDNPACCNPEHMFIGSDKDNVNDAINKGRMQRNPHNHEKWRPGLADRAGEANGNSRLKIVDVKTIRHLYFAERRNQSEIARFFNVGRTQVGRIVRGEHWV